MATEPIPKLDGQITVESGVNDQMDFWETVAGDNTAIIAQGDYWPADLASEIQTKLNAIVSGWTVSVSNTTGKMTISRGSGWYPKNTSSESQQLWCGGDDNIDTGNPLATDEVRPHHIGFQRDAAYPGSATSHTSDIAIANCFYPSEPPAEDPFYKLSKTVRVAEATDGTLYHADYTGQGKGVERRRLRFEFQLEAKRFEAVNDWWRWYATAGGEIRYYPDRTLSDYKTYKLAADSVDQDPFNRQQQGFGWYSGSFTLQRHWG